ncbi:protein kinase domain-containing protein [Geminocystis sp. NIES-3709]|uniref:protein kinase domain-containing protein n=1 Tax=Geminocystis sp. NIES-3709 TaxID=1617448 RepID=UPI0005FC5383|nr:protein kinase [Geminocystis sp. NIES-3709]BAQ65937.1 serine/threonine kinase [Geminocystis sp. NIES-3709]
MENINDSNQLQNYQILDELGRHPESIYINYLAKNNINNQSVILTDLILPQSSINTDKNIEYKIILELLQSLKHQGIPHHLDCFESQKGFCLVQEYPASKPQISTNQWTLEEIKKIALSALDILTYLQEQNSVIFHHQINPNNLLIDSDFQVYLINFGFAQFDNITFPSYSMMNKSHGFIPPEKKRGRELTKNSDLYSLGVTLSCLITGTDVNKVSNLIGQDGAFNLQRQISNKMSLTWIEWLENIVAINPNHRYSDAITALNIINNVDINCLPNVQISPSILEFKANYYGEIITQNILINNTIIDTDLVGQWEIIPSKYDIMLDNIHPWITLKPEKFTGNKIQCQITIDTNKLKTDKIYNRKLIIKANSSEKNHIFPLKIETAKIKMNNIFYNSLIVLFIVALICGWLSGIMVSFTPDFINWLVFILGLVIGSIGGYGASFSKINWFIKAVASITPLIIIISFVGLGTDVDLIVGFIAGLIITCVAGMMIKFYLEKNTPRIITIILALLTAGFGISFGIDLSFTNNNSFLLLLIKLTTGLPLILILLNPYWEYKKQLNHYHKQKQLLIKY